MRRFDSSGRPAAVLALLLALLLVGLVPGCEILGGTGPGGDDDDDDTADPWVTPSGVPDDVECRPLTETPAPGEAGLGECVTGTLACGETVHGTLAGGSTVFSSQHDLAFEQCSGHSTGDDLDGPERVYRLDVPSNFRYVSMHLSSCETTQILWYQTDQVCPTEHVACSYVGVHGGYEQSEDILLGSSGVLWFVIEGLEGAVGNYTLTVECGE
jgi:hypothetical protein